MEVTKGKLVNVKTKKELAFAINPTEFTIATGFEFAVEPRLGQASQMVSYRTAGPARLSFAVHFDKDADDKATPEKVEAFLKSIGEVDAETRSIPKVEFKFGSTLFRGFTKQYKLVASRFDNKAEVTSVRLDMEIISDGSFEGEGN